MRSQGDAGSGQSVCVKSWLLGTAIALGLLLGACSSSPRSASNAAHEVRVGMSTTTTATAPSIFTEPQGDPRPAEIVAQRDRADFQNRQRVEPGVASAVPTAVAVR